MSAIAVPKECQRASTPILFDPEGDVLTTSTLDAFVEEGKPMLNNYVRHVKVGGGQHGEVYLCHMVNARLPPGHPDRRIPVAMKSVKRNNPRAEKMKSLRKQRLPATDHLPVADKLNTTEAKIRKEIAIMKKLRHPHVIRLYEVIDDRMEKKIYMIMEYMGGGEVKWRDDNNQPVLTISQTRRILRDAVLGLEYLHRQGIIHRDIKPANLLWTDDRRQVKIGDFGVSHFSYAQALAAAGGNGGRNRRHDPNDPLLLDDSSLTRRAGTPSFLAPEVIYEHTAEMPSLSSSALTAGSSTSVHTVMSTPNLNGERPQITKSIDVWALGVTLYCLLFGTTPFVADKNAPGSGSEFSLYNAICNKDWTVPPTMGYDRIRTGGRHPDPNREGSIIIHLLDHFLQKDYNLRITLDEVKHSIDGSQKHPWILKDLDDPQKWLQITSPVNKINVSVNETSGAMSAVHFRWRWGGKIAKHVTSLFRNVRPLPRSQAPLLDYSDAEPRGAVMSDPHDMVRRNKSVEGAMSSPTVVNKGKAKAEFHKPPKAAKDAKASRSKSIENWPSARTQTPSVPAPKARRGSDAGLLTREVSSLSKSASEKKTRFGLFLNWRPNKYPQPAGTIAPGADYTHVQSTRAFGTHAQGTPSSRRSEEALRYLRQAQSSDDGANLTAARRASSWGQGDKELHEVVSVTSVEHTLNEHDMNVGAGGLSHKGDGGPVAGPSGYRLEPVIADETSFEEEDIDARYGQPCYDDSSTIASEAGEWQRGSEMSSEFDDGDGDDDDDDEFVDDDESSDQENGVTFSPRRRPENLEE
ncbi:kinase-like domain-containing protein [Crassisporium funariophilum]|nr:kinase-like domain-containing protein [Crassisporium funariophilum]